MSTLRAGGRKFQLSGARVFRGVVSRVGRNVYATQIVLHTYGMYVQNATFSKCLRSVAMLRRLGLVICSPLTAALSSRVVHVSISLSLTDRQTDRRLLLFTEILDGVSILSVGLSRRGRVLSLYFICGLADSDLFFFFIVWLGLI